MFASYSTAIRVELDGVEVSIDWTEYGDIEDQLENLDTQVGQKIMDSEACYVGDEEDIIELLYAISSSPSDLLDNGTTGLRNIDVESGDLYFHIYDKFYNEFEGSGSISYCE